MEEVEKENQAIEKPEVKESSGLQTRRFFGIALLSFLAWDIFTQKKSKVVVANKAVARGINQTGKLEET